jgi:hypothetical protein
LGGSRSAAWAAGSLAIAGGLLVLASGFEAHGLLLTALGLAKGYIPRYIAGIAGLTAVVAVDIVALLISLGGFTIIVGGVLVLLGHRTLGRVLIAIGGGAGFIGLLISFGYSAFSLGLGAVLGNAPYWAGIALAACGRWVAKKS